MEMEGHGRSFSLSVVQGGWCLGEVLVAVGVRSDRVHHFSYPKHYFDNVEYEYDYDDE